mmetsp:Transcript_73021/g.145200  ORF Transcript_73021/g.145200 Transcript_73021/m.145200 type:complete len:123 (+) Transcript_73021:163-531(+)
MIRSSMCAEPEATTYKSSHRTPSLSSTHHLPPLASGARAVAHSLALSSRATRRRQQGPKTPPPASPPEQPPSNPPPGMPPPKSPPGTPPHGPPPGTPPPSVPPPSQPPRRSQCKTIGYKGAL